MVDNKKINILFLGQMPPPLNGVSLINTLINTSFINSEIVKFKFINTSTSSSSKDITKYSFLKFFIVFKTIFKIFFTIYEENYDMVYCTLSPTGKGFIKDSLYLIFPKWLIKKTIIHLHGKGINANYKKLNKYIYNYVFKQTHVIVLSEKLLFDIKKIGTIKSISILGNGCENYGQKNKNLPDFNKLNFLYFSNFIKSKGIMLLLEALNILNKKKIEFCAIFAGEDVDITRKDLLDYIEKNNLGAKVSVLSAKYGIEKNQLFSESNIFIFPTQNDCFPIVLIEALQFGHVVISTKEGAIEDIIIENESGILLDDVSPDTIANTIIHLSQNRNQLERISVNSRNRYHEKFTDRIFIHNLLKIIIDIYDME